MGIDAGRHAERLRARIRDLTERFQANYGITSISTGPGAILLADWELQALRNNGAESGELESFRTQLARSLSYSIGVVSRIQEEMPAYYETKGVDHLWKPHCEALLYLAYEGRRRLEALNQLAAESKKRGLLEKARQISQSASRLAAALSRIEQLSEPGWLREHLR